VKSIEWNTLRGTGDFHVKQKSVKDVLQECPEQETQSEYNGQESDGQALVDRLDFTPDHNRPPDHGYHPPFALRQQLKQHCRIQDMFKTFHSK